MRNQGGSTIHAAVLLVAVSAALLPVLQLMKRDRGTRPSRSTRLFPCERRLHVSRSVWNIS